MTGDLIALVQVSVDPAHGGQGIGRQFLSAVASEARDRGYRAITGTTFREECSDFGQALHVERQAMAHEVSRCEDQVLHDRDLAGAGLLAPLTVWQVTHLLADRQ
ncbi:MAG: N-acetyltransferase family protein [Nocardioidaceae bacterium]